MPEDEIERIVYKKAAMQKEIEKDNVAKTIARQLEVDA